MSQSKLWHRFMPPIPWRKEFYGNMVYFNLRDCAYLLRLSTAYIEKTERFSKILNGTSGAVWDVGCNVGIFSMLAASKNHKVIAFDISPKAITHLLTGAAHNHVLIETVCREFSLIASRYNPPSNARPSNHPVPGCCHSITYLEAALRHGVPSLIKMDIEGGEFQFLNDAGFKCWIVKNKISFLVEMHGAQPIWTDIPHIESSPSHILYNPTKAQLDILNAPKGKYLT